MNNLFPSPHFQCVSLDQMWISCSIIYMGLIFSSIQPFNVSHLFMYFLTTPCGKWHLLPAGPGVKPAPLHWDQWITREDPSYVFWLKHLVHLQFKFICTYLLPFCCFLTIFVLLCSFLLVLFSPVIWWLSLSLCLDSSSSFFYVFMENFCLWLPGGSYIVV